MAERAPSTPCLGSAAAQLASTDEFKEREQCISSGENRLEIVTGPKGGIGFAIAERPVRNGLDVIIISFIGPEEIDAFVTFLVGEEVSAITGPGPGADGGVLKSVF
jgi:hypothetical protein